VVKLYGATSTGYSSPSTAAKTRACTAEPGSANTLVNTAAQSRSAASLTAPSLARQLHLVHTLPARRDLTKQPEIIEHSEVLDDLPAGHPELADELPPNLLAGRAISGNQRAYPRY
jgi:hypothetical protein